MSYICRQVFKSLLVAKLENLFGYRIGNRRFFAEEVRDDRRIAAHLANLEKQEKKQLPICQLWIFDEMDCVLLFHNDTRMTPNDQAETSAICDVQQPKSYGTKRKRQRRLSPAPC